MASRFPVNMSRDVYDALTYHARRMGLTRPRLADALLRQALKLNQLPVDAIETSRHGSARSTARLPKLDDLPFLKKY